MTPSSDAADAPRARAGRYGARARRFGGAAVVVAAGCCLALVINGLIARSIASSTHVEEALAVTGAIRQIDGWEWRAVAGADLDEVRSGVAAAHDELATTLDAMGERGRELGRAADRYVAAIDDMIAALERGDAAGAADIDEARVDPGFEDVIALAERIVDAESRAASATRDAVHLLVWCSSLAIASALGVALTVIGTLRRRQAERSIVSALDRRFRSMVEGSLDVITVVSGRDDVAVVSPTLGALRECAAGATPGHMPDLLPASAVERWRVVDEQVRSGAGHRRIEISIDRPDGSQLHLEGDGSLLDGHHDERAWVWRDVTERKDLELQLTHQAFHDPLTGMPNRSLLRDRTEHALRVAVRTAAPVTMLFCDLDDFKAINDTLGHRFGDELLHVVARRLAACVRVSDTVARFGGDEFAILLEGLDVGEATALAERIVDVVAAPLTLDGRSIAPAMSIGIATARPGADTDELLRSADLAMYEAKRRGKRRVHAYEREMLDANTNVLQLQADLKLALERHELEVHYQPTVDIATGRIFGVEALLRWHHPVLGSIPPDRFIPLAEANGTIVPIGRWVVEQACRAAAELQSATRRIVMAVNLSPRQLHDPTIGEHVRASCTASGIDPSLLVLEVTEGLLLDDELAVRRLHELRALGLRVAIDDFGTGYTSISYLQSLPVDIVKIDRAYVSGDALAPDDRHAFLSAIVSLVHTLDLRAVAEGIEQRDQLDELRRLGCDEGQGFYWSPALPVAELLRRITAIDGGIDGGIDDVTGTPEQTLSRTAR